MRGKKSAKLVLEDILPARSEKKRKKSRFAEVKMRWSPTLSAIGFHVWKMCLTELSFN